MFKANYNVEYPQFTLGGSAVGFTGIFGENINNTKNQPLAMQIWYNGCMCPLSFFEHQGDLNAMDIVVNTDSAAKV